QLETWKWLGTIDVDPWSPKTRVSTLNGSQFVGLTVKFGRFRLIWIERRRSGIPSRIVGIGSETVVIFAVGGSTWTAARTTTLPRSYGPETAGTTTTRLIGAPL